MIGNLLDHYAARAQRISDRDNNPAALPDKATWEKQRPEFHQQYMISLGLGSLPPKCDLTPQITGTFQGQGYHAQKIAYQILPNVWASAHLYRPASLKPNQKAPAVLYCCGHHISGTVGYQKHAIAWAKRGYICLIFDTIEQHDNPGEHHGLHSGNCPGWISMGYNAAGGEVYNGIRALDLLLSQPDVDPARVGATGISGGGSQSYRLALVDDRIAAVAPVAGIADPVFSIRDRHVQNHCDCFFDHNRFARDITHWAALNAPRPILLCFAKHDQLFTPEEYHAIYNHLKARYEKLGIADRCQFLEYDGQHGYNFKSTCDTIHDFFDQYVSKQPHPEADTLAIGKSAEMNTEVTLTINNGSTPQPNHLEQLPFLLSHQGQVQLPTTPDQWPAIRKPIIERLRSEVFVTLDDVASPQTLTQRGDWTHEGTDRFAWRGQLDGMAQAVMQLSSAAGTDKAVVICIGDREDDALHLAAGVRGGESQGKWKVSAIGIEPRAAGRTAFPASQRKNLNREGLLVGLTPTAMMVQDLHHIMPHILALPSVANLPVHLYGKGEGALAMLYYALLNPSPAFQGVILENLPWTHREGPNQILGVDAVLQLGQAAGLLAPLPLALIPAQGWGTWHWTSRAYARLDAAGKLIYPANVTAAINAWIPD